MRRTITALTTAAITAGTLLLPAAPALARPFMHPPIIDGEATDRSATSGDVDPDGDVDGSDFLLWQSGGTTEGNSWDGTFLGGVRV